MYLYMDFFQVLGKLDLYEPINDFVQHIDTVTASYFCETGNIPTTVEMHPIWYRETLFQVYNAVCTGDSYKGTRISTCVGELGIVIDDQRSGMVVY